MGMQARQILKQAFNFFRILQVRCFSDLKKRSNHETGIFNWHMLIYFAYW